MKMDTEVLSQPTSHPAVTAVPTTWRGCARISRSCDRRCAASRWSISTTPPPRQKPQCVIDAEVAYYSQTNANVHRGVHTLSQRATDDYEAARDKVQRFINAASTKEIVFVRGTTEAINLVAQSYARPRLSADDDILISAMEHHSNIVPWQMVCASRPAQSCAWCRSTTPASSSSTPLPS